MSTKSSLKQVMNNQCIMYMFPLVKTDDLQCAGSVDHRCLDQVIIARKVTVM